MSGIVEIVITAVIVIFVVSSFLKIAYQHERIVLYTLGKYSGVRGPGLIMVVPIIQTTRKIDTRVMTLDISGLDAVTRDNVKILVSCVVSYQVVDAEEAVNNVRSYETATDQITQTAIRSMLGENDLNDIQVNQQEINQTIQKTIDEQSSTWGVKVSKVEIKDIVMHER